MTDKNKQIDELGLCRLLMDYAQDGVTLQELQDIPDDTMEGIYAHAHYFYKQGKLDDAEQYFSLLCMYDLHNADYFIGLGAVNQLKKRYQRACDIYGLAYILSEEADLSPMFYSGQCHLMMGNILLATRSFNLVVENSNEPHLVKKAKVYIDTIKDNKQELVQSRLNDDNRLGS